MSEEKWEEPVERDEGLEQERAAEAERRAASVERPPVPPRPVAAEPVTRREIRRSQRRGYRSLFWPVVLIGAGVLWLLSNFGIIGAENWSVLFRLWPILLIAAGLDLLVGRFSALLGSLIGLLTVAAVVALVIIGPSMGWAGDATLFGMPVMMMGQDVEVQHGTFDEPVSGADSADITLDLASPRTTVTALGAGSDNLIEADVDYFGEFRFDVSGDARRTVSLGQEFAQVGVFGPWNQPERANMEWNIGLSPDVPMDLRIDVGSGAADVDLSDLSLTSLDLDGGSGRANMQLPAVGDVYDVRYDAASGSSTLALAAGSQVDLEMSGGSGAFTLTVGEGSTLVYDLDGASGSNTIELADDVAAEMSVAGGSGPITIDVSDDAAVRVEVRDGGAGSVRLGPQFDQVSDGDDDDEDTGIWETRAFEDADVQIVIVVRDVASGPINVD